MTRVTWAERKAARKWKTPELQRIYAAALKAEHARSVRIVKRLMKGYINKNFNGQFYDRIDTCEYILHLLQRGRGKGGVK